MNSTSAPFRRNSKRAHNIITTAVVTGPASAATTLTTSTLLAPPSVGKGMSRSPSGSGKSVTFVTEEDGIANTKCRNNNKEQQPPVVVVPNNNVNRKSLNGMTNSKNGASPGANSIIAGTAEIMLKSGNGCNSTNNGDIIPMTTLGDNIISSRPPSDHLNEYCGSPTSATGVVESPFGITVTNDRIMESQN
ncbi:unnamed protein product [Orchesella dallaii]|uniref:Uncharacterized protein n=1 Tax=Orchesella dallaii TaxID=48710 RepID=A0ABP1QVG0_9HEXA